MKLKSRALGALAGLFAFAVIGGVANATDRPYTEGTVSIVNSLRTKPGMYDTYMKYLATTYRQLMEEAKKAGHVVDYNVYSTSPRGPNDPNVYLVVTYKNMAALDGLSDRMDGIQQKIVGSPEQRDAAAIDREKMRTMVGSEMIRHVVFK
jgi:hypothetical protein